MHCLRFSLLLLAVQSLTTPFVQAAEQRVEVSVTVRIDPQRLLADQWRPSADEALPRLTGKAEAEELVPPPGYRVQFPQGDHGRRTIILEPVF